MSPAKVLLIDDDDTLRRVLTRELEQLGFAVAALADARDLVNALDAQQPDVVLLDLRLPGVSGHEALAIIKKSDPDLPVVVLTGHGSVEDAVQAMHAGAYDFLQKPTRTAILEQTLRRACERRALARENERLKRVAGHPTQPKLLGESAPMRQLLDEIGRVARSDASVLILGENGTGKELVARAVHASSQRRDQSFVVVNCSAVPGELVHSELFGHVKGSFTGAERPRVGLFEAADAGTLFLDEVGDLPIDMQPALLRAIQFGEVRPVGSDRTRHVDVRVLAATNRNLHAMMRDGRFREDLFFRLATLDLRVPPLRERAADIPLLAAAFLHRCNARSGRTQRFSDPAVARLCAHAWPGNVRELENAITRVATMVDADCIEAADIDRFVLASMPHRDGDLPTLQIAELERMAIDAAMRRFGGDKKRAAEAVGVSLKTLYNKLNAQRDHAPEA